MSIRGRFYSYAGAVAKGNVRIQQLVNLLGTTLMLRREIVTWQPTHLSIFVTSRCSFNCDMCPTRSRRVPKTYLHRHEDAPDMTLDLLRVILRRFPGALRAELIGVGEPLLNPHLFELIDECVKHKLIVDTVSNGLVLGAYAQDIVNSGLDRICVSVNGHTPQEFHRITGMLEAHHSQILKNVETLVRARSKRRAPRIEVSFIVDQQNYRHMEEMVAVAEQLGVDGANLYNFLPNPYEGFTAAERCVYADDPGIQEEVARLVCKQFRCEVAWPPLLKHVGRSTGQRKICRWPFTLLQVDGNGNIGGCPTMLLSMHENGKVTDADAWNNSYFRDLRKRHLAGDVLEPCKSCSECVGIEARQVVQASRRLSD